MLNELTALARLIRTHLVRMTTTAGAGHLTSSLSAVELMTALMFGGVFRADLKRPKNPANDRLIFSKGHASPLLYALYAAAGAISFVELKQYRQFGSRLEGHPTKRFPFTEVPTGSLGQGLSVALGEAVAATLAKSPARIYCLLGDSEMAEGSVWEAIQYAGFRRQDNIVAIVDFNGLGQSGPTMYGHNALSLARRVQAFGWRTAIVDGHVMPDILHALTVAQRAKGQPFMLIARTVKGRGVTMLEGREGWHGQVLTHGQAAVALKELGRVDPRLRGQVKRPPKRAVVAMTRRAVKDLSYKTTMTASPRMAIGNGLVRLQPAWPQLIVLDGEVKNSTYTEEFAKKFPKRFIEGYVAEQNIVGLATGAAARGLLPVTATFGAFFTRAYDQLRMASYAGDHQVLVGTHPGVHIGSDGLSQMALQDIALFRTLEGSTVLYPADAIAAERLLERGLRTEGLVYLRATRAALPVIYGRGTRFPIGGSHTLRRHPQDRATLVVAGVTVHEALKAAAALSKRNIHVRVIDLYSIKPLDVATLKQAARQTKHLIVAEDHYPEGGIGEAVRAALGREAGTVISLAVRKTPRSGQPEELLAWEGLDAAAMQKKILSL